MSEKSYTLALFNDFDAAASAIAALRESSIKGFKMADVTLKSPIDHPECAAELGPRPVYIQLFSLIGGLLGGSLGFLLISSAQANFLRQPRGGFPIVPIPPNMVITYELVILTTVIFTVAACLIIWKLPGRRSPLYNVNISVDKIGLLVKSDPAAAAAIKDIFSRHHALEIEISSSP
jgi:hypothetical protein